MEKQYFYQISGRNQKDGSVTMKKRLSNNNSVTVNNEREQWKKSIYHSDFAGKLVVQGYSVLSPYPSLGFFLQRENRKHKMEKRKEENKKSTMLVKKRLGNNSSVTVNNERE